MHKAYLQIGAACMFNAFAAVAATPIGLVSPTVVDANGTVIGSVVSIDPNNNDVVVMMSGANTIFTIDVLREGFVAPVPEITEIFFNSSDCTGQGYLDASYAPSAKQLVPPGYVVGEEQTVFVPKPVPLHYVLVNSYFEGVEGCKATSTSRSLVVPATREARLRGAFVPPFVVRE